MFGEWTEQLQEYILCRILSFAFDGLHWNHLECVCKRWQRCIDELPFWEAELRTAERKVKLLKSERSWRQAWTKRQALQELTITAAETVQVKIVETLSWLPQQVVIIDNESAYDNPLCQALNGYRFIHAPPANGPPLACLHDRSYYAGPEDMMVHTQQMVNMGTGEILSCDLVCTNIDQKLTVLTLCFCVSLFTHETPEDSPTPGWSDSVVSVDFSKRELPIWDTFTVCTFEDIVNPKFAFCDVDGSVDEYSLTARENEIFYLVERPDGVSRVRSVSLGEQGEYVCTWRSDEIAPGQYTTLSLTEDGQVRLHRGRVWSAGRFDTFDACDAAGTLVRDQLTKAMSRLVLIPTIDAAKHKLTPNYVFISPCERFILVQYYDNINGPQRWLMHDLLRKRTEKFVRNEEEDLLEGTLVWVCYYVKGQPIPKFELLRVKNSPEIKDMVQQILPVKSSNATSVLPEHTHWLLTSI